jgi:hypothetical protein
MLSTASRNRYLATYERLAPAAFPKLWDWQREVLHGLSDVSGDAAIELPTGSGKTVAALLVCEEYRRRTSRPVAYLTGTKQLTAQVKSEADRLGVPAVAFHGPKITWEDDRKTDYEFATSIGVMNFWNYLNESPGVSPAGLLVMDDVHLAEGPLRDFFAVFIPSSDDLFTKVLRRIRARFPYYTIVNDLLDGLFPALPAEMLSPLDSLELAREVSVLLDAHLPERSSAWWAWQRTRTRAQACCWLVSARGLTITPWIPPSQTIDHFSEPERRLYLSATVGDLEDLRRRIGCPPAQRITATVPSRQGKRFVALVRPDREQTPEELIAQARPLLAYARKALWLCARSTTATAVQAELTGAGLGDVHRLHADNGAAEHFTGEDDGQLLCAGRYDGMDFPGEACQLEILPEIPVATSELEDFVSAYLRDAPFARSRFAQRVAQALGRCNRGEQDRAAYLLWDPGFFAALGNPRGLALLPAEVRGDVYAAVRRSGDPDTAVAEALRFLNGEEPEEPSQPLKVSDPGVSTPAEDELQGVMRLWSEDYRAAAASFARAAAESDGAPELRGFWLAMRALALTLAQRSFADDAAGRKAPTALAEALSSGAANTFFSRLRASQARASSAEVKQAGALGDSMFASWDTLLDRRRGVELERWVAAILEDLEGGSSHDGVVRALAELGGALGVGVQVPKAKQGEHDLLWELSAPGRLLVFEVKLAPKAKSTSIKDINQAEGAVRAVEAVSPAIAVRGLLVTPHEAIESSAVARLERVRLVRLADLQAFAQQLLDLLALYSDGWSEDAKARERARERVESRLPDSELLWKRKKSPDTTPWVALSRRALH